MLEEILENLVMQGLIKEMDISDFDSVSEFVLNLTDEAIAKIEANYISKAEVIKAIPDKKRIDIEIPDTLHRNTGYNQAIDDFKINLELEK